MDRQGNVANKNDGVGGENWAKTGSEDTSPAEEEGNEIALPHRPVERVIRVVRRLGRLSRGQQLKF